MFICVKSVVDSSRLFSSWDNKSIDFKNSSEELIVVLIQIEDFYYINIHLNEKESRKVQKKFAKKILKLIPRSCNFSKIYLLDRGRFVLTRRYKDCKDNIEEAIESIKEFQHFVNRNRIKIKPIDYDLSIIVSFSYGKNAFRNAQIGLKRLRKTKEDFIVASKLLQIKQDIAKRKIKTFQMVRKAIDSYNIVSYFQPIVNNRTMDIEKYESLVRLIDENKNIVPPNLFLDTAKEGKYYAQITAMVLTNSFDALYHTDMNISINFSSLDIEKSSTQEKFFELLRDNKSEAHRVTLELLEDERIQNINIMKEFIEKVKRFGVKIAIDDFGTGYSNFQRLLEYKPDIIKIDGSLIENIEKDDFSRHMVETIVAFSKKEDIETVAEYVKSKEIFKIVCDLGVDYSQGYYFGKPDVLK
jgi:EAL domain-containing protein (putative c-di-GMP-specific phosphodiesterase class I)